MTGDWIDDLRTVSMRLVGYVEGLRKRGALDGLPAGDLKAIDRYLAEIDRILEEAKR